jgi:hypothetical protein
MFTQKSQIGAWLGLLLFALLCVSREPEGWRTVCFLAGWALSAIATLSLSKGHRTKASILILISGALVRNTAVYLSLSLACVMGD